MMKQLGLIIAAVTFAASAAADGAATVAQPNMAVAASEAGVAMQWELPESDSAQSDTLDTQDLESQSRALNEKMGAQLDERLNEKLNRQLQADF